MNGYIKLHRRLIDWEWYNDLPVKCLFLHLLLTANHKEKSWQGIEIKPGQTVTSRQSLARETSLSEQQIRTAISKLKSTGEITITSTSKYSLITLENWALYQLQDDESTNDQPTEQPTINQRSTTNKNDKKINMLIDTKDMLNNMAHLPSKREIDLSFETAWKRYPIKKGKGQVSDADKRRVHQLGDEFLRCIDRYIEDVKFNDRKYWKHGSTFFHSGYVDYLDENYDTKNVTGKEQQPGEKKWQEIPEGLFGT